MQAMRAAFEGVRKQRETGAVSGGPPTAIQGQRLLTWGRLVVATFS